MKLLKLSSIIILLLFLNVLNLHAQRVDDPSLLQQMNHEVVDFGLRVFILGMARYLLVAGLAYLFFYVVFKKKWFPRKIQQNIPSSADYRREILYSFLTIVIFLGVALMIYTEPVKSYTTIYSSIKDYGWGYWLSSVFLMILLHDTYFYWTHRILHHPKVFKIFHLVHHRSTNPSPWAAFAFHPLEGIVEAGIVVVIAFTIPFHATALFAFLLFMTIYNVYGHLGYELYPKNFNKTLFGKWMNTSVNHNMHHKYFKGNYGLYFLFWDSFLGTLHPDYDKLFEENS